MKEKVIISAVAILGSITTYYFTQVYLQANFDYSGEAFYKGEGHLLRENLAKGILFIVLRNLFCCAFLALLAFLLVPNKRTLYLTFGILLVAIFIFLLLYTVYEWTNIVDPNFDRKERILEIELTWLSRGLGFILSYQVSKYFLFKESILRHIS